MPKSVNKTKHIEYTAVTMTGGGNYDNAEEEEDEEEEEIRTDSYHQIRAVDSSSPATHHYQCENCHHVMVNTPVMSPTGSGTEITGDGITGDGITRTGTKISKDLIDFGEEEDIINRNCVRGAAAAVATTTDEFEHHCCHDDDDDDDDDTFIVENKIRPCSLRKGFYHPTFGDEETCLTETGECSACPMMLDSCDEEEVEVMQQVYQEHTLEVYDTSVFKQDECLFGADRGFHIVALSMAAIPFVFLITCVISGYLGVLTWYNIFLYFYERRGVLCRITVCPFLVLIFPPVIVLIIVGLSTYTAIGQLSWFLSAWKISISDFEKGFFAWMCIYLELKECCPYEVIIITEEEDLEGFADEVANIGESTPPITPV